MSLHERVMPAILAAGRDTAREMTPLLHDQALSAGWPAEAADKVKAHYGDGRLHASFRGAEDWEYGAVGRPPLAVARTFEGRLHEDANPAFMRHLSKHLGAL